MEEVEIEVRESGPYRVRVVDADGNKYDVSQKLVREGEGGFVSLRLGCKGELPSQARPSAGPPSRPADHRQRRRGRRAGRRRCRHCDDRAGGPPARPPTLSQAVRWVRLPAR